MLRSFFLLTALLLSSTASAQNADLREGVLVRLGLGVGGLADHFETDPVFGFSIAGDAGGATIASEIAVGAALGDRFSVGGLFAGESVANPTVTIGGTEVEGAGVGTLTQLGPFLNVHLQPKAGAWFGGGFAFAALQFRDDDGNTSDNPPVGGSFFLQGGYELAPADRLGVGVMGRLTVGSLSEDGATHTVRALSVLFALHFD